MKVIALFVLIIVPIGLMILALIFSLFTKNKLMNWLVSSFIFLGLYFAYLSDFEIPFYYLNPAYYKFQSECKKLPKPVIYDEDYWEMWSDLKKYPLIMDEEGNYYHISKKGERVYTRKWEEKRREQKVSWGTMVAISFLRNEKLLAKVLSYSYNGLVFRFGASGIGFMTEVKQCKNYERRE